MDLISNNAIEVSTLALNGLAARNNALAANIANADTPGYKRVDVNFEGQLGKILGDSKIADEKKIQNSMGMVYNPSSLDTVSDMQSSFNQFDSINDAPNMQQEYDNFKPETAATDTPAIKPDGNNVSMEYEMAELAKNGTKYTAMSTFEERMFRNLQDVIQRGV